MVKKRLFKMISVLLGIMLVLNFVTCSDSSGKTEPPAGILTITNFSVDAGPKLTLGHWSDGAVFLEIEDPFRLYFSAGVPTADNEFPMGSLIQGQSITLDVYVSVDWERGDIAKYKGNDTIAKGTLYLYDTFEEEYIEGETEYLTYVNKKDIVFRNGCATIDFANDMEPGTDYDDS